jgi:4-carboxymuconolactone decarboxylase
MTESEQHRLGQEVRNQLFGERAGTAAKFLPDALARYTTEVVFGDLWQQPELSIQEREMATSAMLIALGREAEQRFHFTGARNLGIERSKIEALITHAAFYAGWGTAVSAARILHEVWPADEDPPVTWPAAPPDPKFGD